MTKMAGRVNKINRDKTGEADEMNPEVMHI